MPLKHRASKSSEVIWLLVYIYIYIFIYRINAGLHCTKG
jgi:hypothetical protein